MTFIDTNIFFYSVDKTEPEKQKIAQNVLRNLLNNQNGQIVEGLKIVNPFNIDG